MCREKGILLLPDIAWVRKILVVYMRNSGIGNAVNPLLFLVDEKVYNLLVFKILLMRRLRKYSNILRFLKGYRKSVCGNTK